MINQIRELDMDKNWKLIEDRVKAPIEIDYLTIINIIVRTAVNEYLHPFDNQANKSVNQ